jgi:hypothetical protein
MCKDCGTGYCQHGRQKDKCRGMPKHTGEPVQSLAQPAAQQAQSARQWRSAQQWRSAVVQRAEWQRAAYAEKAKEAEG